MTLPLRHWRDGQIEKGRREKGESETDGETLRRTERVFMHVCGHMYTNVSSIDAKKKVGQRISHHLLRGEERRTWEEGNKDRGETKRGEESQKRRRQEGERRKGEEMEKKRGEAR